MVTTGVKGCTLSRHIINIGFVFLFYNEKF